MCELSSLLVIYFRVWAENLYCQHFQGGKTLANKTKRFQEPKIDTPGPGAYQLAKKRDWIKEGGRQTQSAPSAETAKKSGGNVRFAPLFRL